MFNAVFFRISETITQKVFNPLAPFTKPFQALDNIGQIKDHISQAKLAVYILTGVLAAILIAFIILIFKKRK